MKHLKRFPLAAVIITIMLILEWTDTSAEHFTAIVSSPEQEAEYVCDLIQNYEYFRVRGYGLDLPAHPVVDELLEKEQAGTLQASDCAALHQAFEEDIYDERDYRRAYRKVKRSLQDVDQVYPVFQEYNELWRFTLHDTYEVRLTLYGPGGMFDSESGTIWLMITDADSFKMHDDPKYVIIHEATHIGLDKPIVARYGLAQPALERLVDQFIVHHFSEILPEYPMQELGDRSIDPYLADRYSWILLPKHIKAYMADE